MLFSPLNWSLSFKDNKSMGSFLMEMALSSNDRETTHCKLLFEGPDQHGTENLIGRQHVPSAPASGENIPTLL